MRTVAEQPRLVLARVLGALCLVSMDAAGLALASAGVAG